MNYIKCFIACVALLFVVVLRFLNRNKRPTIIAIEGNIGVGKTTLLDKLKLCKNINKNSEFISEPVDIWLGINDDDGKNILGKFYEDKRRWSYTFQNFSYITKMTKLVDAVRKSGKQLIFLDRSIGTDKNVFAKMLYDDKMLGKLEYAMYNLWSNFYDKYIAKDGHKNIIYLRCDPQVAYNRIQKRGRTEEKDIPIEYIKSLHEYHEKWINDEIKNTNTSVLVLDWNIDCCDEQIIKNIEKCVFTFVDKCKNKKCVMFA